MELSNQLTSPRSLRTKLLTLGLNSLIVKLGLFIKRMGLTVSTMVSNSMLLR